MIQSAVPSGLLQQSASPKMLMSELQDKFDTTKNTKKEAADQLLLSQLSRMIDLLNLEMGQTDPSGESGQGSLSLEGVESLKQRGQMMANVLKMKIDGFQQNLLQTLKSNGVDTSKPATLQDGGDAGILLEGGHPDAAKIQSLLQNDEGMTAQFQEISRLSALVQGITRTGTDLSGAGAHSPIAAYQQHSMPAESRSADGRFTLRVVEGNGAAEYY